MPRDPDDRELWTQWLKRACGEAGVSPSEVPLEDLLDLAAAVAHGVARPMAPVTAFVAGLAAGRGADAAQVSRALARLARTADDKDD